jgi:hypothetical protein
MRAIFLSFGSLVLVVLVGIGCDSRPARALPTTVIHRFADGLGDWHVETPDAVQDNDMTYLRLHKTKDKRDGDIWKIISLEQGTAKRVSLAVVAKAVTPSAPISIGITCQTGKGDGPTYGVLAAEGKKYNLTSDWATYEMTIDIPKQTREIQLSVGIDLPASGEASADISCIEYVLAGDSR